MVNIYLSHKFMKLNDNHIKIIWKLKLFCKLKGSDIVKYTHE